MGYVYKRPKGHLIAVSISKWNKAFAKRGRWPFIKAEIYISEDTITVQYVKTRVGIIIWLLLAPLFFLMEGFNKENYLGFRKELFDKQYGRFTSDVVYRHQAEAWSKVQKLIGGE